MLNLYKDGKLVAKVKGENAHLAAGTLIAACFADVVKCNGWVVLSDKEARLSGETTPAHYARLMRDNYLEKWDRHAAKCHRIAVQAERSR